jgi:hypothetical protein
MFQIRKNTGTLRQRFSPPPGNSSLRDSSGIDSGFLLPIKKGGPEAALKS